MSDPLDALYSTIPSPTLDRSSPYITLSYAQSLDGSIAIQSDRQLLLSSPESMEMTHHLRGAHDGILVGINTILADNPRLTTRQGNGKHARPIILDTHLRTPARSNIFHHPKSPLLICGEEPHGKSLKLLEDAGAEILVSDTRNDGRIDLKHLMTRLHILGFFSLMVEGGASVISSMLEDQLVDACVITITPKFIGGVHAVSNPLDPAPWLVSPGWVKLGRDLVVWGEINWSTG